MFRPHGHRFFPLDRLEAAVQETIHRRGDEFLRLLTLWPWQNKGRTDARTGETWWLSLLYIKHVFSTSNLIYSMSSPLFLVKVKYQAHYTILYPLWWVKSLVVKSSFTLQSPSLFLKSLLFGISSGAYQGRIPNNPRMGCVTTIHDYSAHFREVTVRYHSFWPMITIIEVYILPSRIAG
jgi:hypothetical protein